MSQAILRAICFRDEEVLNSFLAADFVFIGESGRVARGDFLEAVGSGSFVTVEYGFEMIEIEVVGGAAVAAGIQRVEVELPDKARAVSRQCFTDVFVRVDSKWLVRLAHSVELPNLAAA